ncbi:MAG: GAF domain-containing protein [Dehalococcoidia bacterium]|nr:GAF domain-containing protein [Dehalococcoidia bacterium]
MKGSGIVRVVISLATLSAFFSSNVILVFFVYGLAFFMMGLAVALEARRSSDLTLSSSLPYLAIFALLHGLGQWTEMFLIITPHVPGMNWDVTVLGFIKSILLAISMVFLVQFGADLIGRSYRAYFWMRWLAAGLLLFWVGTTILIPMFSSPSGEHQVVTTACLRCHTNQLKVDITGGGWIPTADVAARYILYLPGSILAALALALHGRSLARRMKHIRADRDCYLAAAGFAANAFFAGLIIPPVPNFPDWLPDYDSFFTVVGVPPQLFRTAFALFIAFFIVRVLRIFEVAQQRQLEAAHELRFTAQQEALEIQRRAQAEIESWNRELENRVQQRTTEIQQREKEAQALYVVGTEISGLLDLGKILNSVVEKATQLLGTEAALLGLLDEKSGEVFVQATAGCFTDALKQLRLKAGQGINGKILITGLPIRVFDYETDMSIDRDKYVEDAVIAEGLRAHLGVPLKIGDRTFGALVVASRSARTFSDNDEYLLMRLANQAAIAIENTRLYGEVQSMAVLEERYRIAREMHDGLAQVLGYLNLRAKSVAESLKQQDTEQAKADISEMDKVIQDAYADVRESILSLRTATGPGKGFLPTLSEFLQLFAQQSRVSTHLDVGEEEEIHFPEAVQVQLVRIIQEALTNVRKHARASTAWVRFRRDGAWAEVTVEDDGQGFDPLLVPKNGLHHIGLQTMKERADGIGASLTIASALDKGTKVILRIPISGEGAVQNGAT